MQVHRAYGRIEDAGAQALGIGTGADYQAQALMDDGLRFQCLVDAESRLYRSLDIRRAGWLRLMAPAGVRRYLAAMRRGGRQGAFTGDIRQLPGLAILDARARVVWLHRGQGLGDYPPLDRVLERVEHLAAGIP